MGTGGIRLRHPTQRNARLTVVSGEFYMRGGKPAPYQCPPPAQGGCGVPHERKTVHLNLDDQGSVIVNEPLYQRLKAVLLASGFEVVEHVAQPPTQTIGYMPKVDLSRPVVAAAQGGS